MSRSSTAGPAVGHFVEQQPLRRLRLVEREVSDNGSRLQLVQHVALGVLESVELLVRAGATDIRVASVARTDRGVEILLEGTPPASSPVATTPDNRPTVPR